MYANSNIIDNNIIINNDLVVKNSLCVLRGINKIIWYIYLIIIIKWVDQSNTFKLVIHPKKRKMAERL